MKRIVKGLARRLGYDIRRSAPPAPVACAEPPLPTPAASGEPTIAAPEPAPVPVPVWNEPEPAGAFLEQQRLLRASPPRVVFDVGAHHGETARRYRTLFPTATVHSFEPFPESFAALEATAAELADVRAHNLALADREGEAEFHSNAFAPTNSLLPTAAGVEAVWPGGLVATVDRVRVRTTTLDRFCADHSIAAIDLLKIDVQGAEPLVLKGAEGLLRAGRVRMVYTEILVLPTYDGQARLDEFLSMMRGYGFELFNFFNLSVTAAGQLRQVDAIFIPVGSASADRA